MGHAAVEFREVSERILRQVHAQDCERTQAHQRAVGLRIGVDVLMQQRICAGNANIEGVRSRPASVAFQHILGVVTAHADNAAGHGQGHFRIIGWLTRDQPKHSPIL